MPGSNFHPWHLVCKYPHYSSHMENFSCSCWRCAFRKSLIMKLMLHCSNEKFLQGCFLQQGQRVTQPPEFREVGFFCSVFNLWSFFSSRSSQILSPFFLLACQLLPGNFSLCGGTGQGTRPPLDWLPAPSPSNRARHWDALQRAANQPATFVPAAPVTSGTGGVPGATIPAGPHSHSKAVAGTQ